MTHDSSSSASRNEETTIIAVETPSYVAFGEWMDEQLEKLVAQWIHAAAPNADKFNRVQEQFGRKGLAK